MHWYWRTHQERSMWRYWTSFDKVCWCVSGVIIPTSYIHHKYLYDLSLQNVLWKPNEHAGYRRDLVVILILCSAFVGCTGIGGGSLGYVEISPILALLFSILFYFCIIISSPHYVLFLTLIAFVASPVAILLLQFCVLLCLLSMWAR